MSNHKLWDIATSLRNDYRYVDLTHSFYPGQPKFGPLEDQITTKLFTVAEHGFEVDRYNIVHENNFPGFPALSMLQLLHTA